MSTRGWMTFGFGSLSAVLAGIGLSGAIRVVLIGLGVASALASVVLASTTATLVLLGVVVAGPAFDGDRPDAVLIAALAGATAAFLLAPRWSRGAESSTLAAAAGVPLAAAITVFAEHATRGATQFLVGLVALIGAFFLALLPVVAAMRRRAGQANPS